MYKTFIHNSNFKKVKEGIQQSSKSFNQSIKKGIQEYDTISKQTNAFLKNLVQENIIGSSIVQTLSNLFTNKK